MKLKFILFLLMTVWSYGQERFLKINLEKSETAILESFFIKNDSSNHYFTLLKYEKELHAYKFDDGKNQIDKISSTEYRKKYIHIIGYVIQDNELLVVLKNKRGSKFISLTYDFIKGSSSQKEYSIPILKEQFIQSFNIANKCFIFTLKGPNQLNLYEFTIDSKYLKQEINIDSVYSNLNFQPKALSDYLTDYSLNSVSQEFPKINNKLPQNLKISTSKKKMYEFENSFIWTFDKYDDHTLLLDFSFPDFKPKLSYIRKKELSGGGVKTNSFLFEDKIAQLVTNSKKLFIEIKSLKGDNKILKHFTFDKNQSINFKSTPIIESVNFNGSITSKTYENTSKFLRKIEDEATGLHIYKKDSTFVMTVGGIKIPTLSGSEPGFSNYDMPENETLSINPGLYTTKLYIHTITTRFISLFDLDFKPKKENIDKTIFERVTRFKNIYGNISAESVFYIDDELIFGFNSLGINQFEFLSFQ